MVNACTVSEVGATEKLVLVAGIAILIIKPEEIKFTFPRGPAV